MGVVRDSGRWPQAGVGLQVGALPAPRGESLTIARLVVTCPQRRVAPYPGRSSDPAEAGQVHAVDNVRRNHIWRSGYTRVAIGG